MIDATIRRFKVFMMLYRKYDVTKANITDTYKKSESTIRNDIQLINNALLCIPLSEYNLKTYEIPAINNDQFKYELKEVNRDKPKTQYKYNALDRFILFYLILDNNYPIDKNIYTKLFKVENSTFKRDRKVFKTLLSECRSKSLETRVLEYDFKMKTYKLTKGTKYEL